MDEESPAAGGTASSPAAGPRGVNAGAAADDLAGSGPRAALRGPLAELRYVARLFDALSDLDPAATRDEAHRAWAVAVDQMVYLTARLIQDHDFGDLLDPLRQVVLQVPCESADPLCVIADRPVVGAREDLLGEATDRSDVPSEGLAAPRSVPELHRTSSSCCGCGASSMREEPPVAGGAEGSPAAGEGVPS